MFFKVKSSSPDSDLAIYRAKRQARLKLTLTVKNTLSLALSVLGVSAPEKM